MQHFPQAVWLGKCHRYEAKPPSSRCVANGPLRVGAGQVRRVHGVTDAMHAPSAEFGAIHQTDNHCFNGERITEDLKRFLLVADVRDKLHVRDVVPRFVYAGRDAAVPGSTSDVSEIPLSTRLG